MPYTPPSKSPASSASSSPETSRRPSVHGFAGNSPRPSLPRSSSYLTKHRRTPSAVSANHGPISQPSPEHTSDDLRAMLNSSAVRQSPPPVTDAKSMPKGAVISPPESGSSDEDDLPEMRGRQLENLKELHAAISQIPQHREGSPDKTINGTREASDLLLLAPQIQSAKDGLHLSFSTSSLEDLKHAHRVSHNRSRTMPDVPSAKSAEASTTNSDDEDEDDPPRPSMVRKKSGELVRPALRPASRRRPSSMPGTPTFSKAVHFDSHLEHVRHFLQVDRPLAVSAGSSPIDSYDSDTEYPFGADNSKPAARTPPFEWEIIINSFPVETPARKALPVRMERVWLSNDHKFLIGSIIVANLAFSKAVVCRFTLDYWKTTSEVTAEYICDVTPKSSELSYDRFNFSIKLADLANLETKTLYFAIKYSVNGQEFWDNNNGTNFQVDFRKKMLPQNGKKIIGAANRPANGLPRSHRRSPSDTPRPKSMPVGFDDFGDKQVNFEQSVHEYLGESAPTSLRLKGSKATASIPSDNLSVRLAAPSGQAFANRYDFGASLSAAMQAAKDTMTVKSDNVQVKSNRQVSPLASKKAKPVAKETQSSLTSKDSFAANSTLPAVPGTGSPGASNIASSTYEEIVNKYCFFGSKQSSPQLQDGTAVGGKFDGSDDNFTIRATNSPWSSSNGSPLGFGTQQRTNGRQQPQTTSSDPNSYFQPSARLVSVGASPDASPLGNSTVRTDSPSGKPRPSTSVLGQSHGYSASPASMGGGFQPLTAIRGN
ncbi:unnamed protein product [Discula destructiva]